MAPKYALAVVLVAAMMCGTLANDVPVKFCAKDCYGNAITDRWYEVQLSGCTDRPATCRTGQDGCCAIDRSPDVIQYCYGSATYLCQWSILSGYNNNPRDPFISDTPTFIKSGALVTPRQFSGCKCDGSDYCAPVIYDYDTTPYTVNFTPKSCSCSQGPVPGLQVFTDTSAQQPGRKLK